jgi:hypothetical protein
MECKNLEDFNEYYWNDFKIEIISLEEIVICQGKEF